MDMVLLNCSLSTLHNVQQKTLFGKEQRLDVAVAMKLFLPKKEGKTEHKGILFYAVGQDRKPNSVHVFFSGSY